MNDGQMDYSNLQYDTSCYHAQRSKRTVLISTFLWAELWCAHWMPGDVLHAGGKWQGNTCWICTHQLMLISLHIPLERLIRWPIGSVRNMSMRLIRDGLTFLLCSCLCFVLVMIGRKRSNLIRYSYPAAAGCVHKIFMHFYLCVFTSNSSPPRQSFIPAFLKYK